MKDKGLTVTHSCGTGFQHPSWLCEPTEMWPDVLREASTLEKQGLSEPIG